MKNVLSVGLVLVMVAFSGNAMATWGSNNNGDCRGNNTCNTDNSTNNAATGGTGVGIGLGVAGAAAGAHNSTDVDASSRNANVNANLNRLNNDSTSVSGAGVFGSGNSSNTNLVGGGDARSDSSVYRSGNSEVDVESRNTNTAFGGQGGDSRSTAFGGNQQQGQIGVNVSENDNASSVSVGDTSLTNEGNTVGDTNVTVVNEGLSDEAARALGQPDVVEVDSRDLSTENQNIDASTTINDNSVYEAPKMSAASAAPSFASICTSGMSGQSRQYGIALSVTSDVCQNLMMADAWMALGNREKAIQYVKRAGSHAKTKSTVGYIRNILTLGVL